VSTEVCEVIITADDADWLAGFTRQLVLDHLSACGQNISPIRSIYRWQGEIQDEAQARVALHTRTNLITEIVKRADEDHPDNVPCVIVLPISGGNPAYIEWVLAETKTPES